MAPRKLSNYAATNLLKQLFKPQELKRLGRCQIVENALSVYERVNKPNHCVINRLLRLCLRFNETAAIKSILRNNDILYLHNISYPTLIRCVALPPFGINECFAVLNAMKTQKFKLSHCRMNQLKMISANLCVIVDKCTQLNEVRVIDSLCQHLSLSNVKTVLIDKYAHFGEVDEAKKVFNQCQKDKVCVGAMMKCFVNNAMNESALQIFEQCAALNLCDDISHCFALKACINTNECKKGKKIISSICDKEMEMVKTTLIDFFGHFGEIDAALSVFYGIDSDKHSVVSVGVIMKALLNNDCAERVIAISEEYEHQMDDLSYSFVLRACQNANNYQKGKDVHSKIMRDGNEHSVQLMNGFIDFYGHFGDV